jgi:hypothetical protein
MWVQILFSVAGLLYILAAIRDKWFPGFIANSGTNPWINVAIGSLCLACALVWHWAR